MQKSKQPRKKKSKKLSKSLKKIAWRKRQNLKSKGKRCKKLVCKRQSRIGRLKQKSSNSRRKCKSRKRL